MGWLRRLMGPIALASLCGVFFTPGVLSQVGTTVVVTAARANLRETPAPTGRVVTQVTSGTTLLVQAVEGDWYKVRFTTGAMQIEAYIAKSVVSPGRGASPGTAATGGRQSEPAGTGATAEPPKATSRDGMSVAWQVGQNATWMTPASTAVLIVPSRANGLEAIAAAAPEPGAKPAATGAAPVTFLWTLRARDVGPEVTEVRPVFVVQFAEVPGLDAAKLTAEIVRLVPTPSGSLAVSGVPGRADQGIWGDADWDVMRTIQQRSVKASIERLGPGAVRVQPAAALPQGTYAVVVRPAGRDRLAGAEVLRGQAEGLLFGVAWPFRMPERRPDLAP